MSPRGHQDMKRTLCVLSVCIMVLFQGGFAGDRVSNSSENVNGPDAAEADTPEMTSARPNWRVPATGEVSTSLQKNVSQSTSTLPPFGSSTDSNPAPTVRKGVPTTEEPHSPPPLSPDADLSWSNAGQPGDWPRDVSNNMEGYDDDEGLTRRDPRLCSGVCGHLFAMPCSCDVRCLVHGNCCEDMITECPDVLDETRRLYPSLLPESAECTARNVFMITSCPNGVENTGGQETPSGKGRGEVKIPHLSDLEKIAPVTDEISGFVFSSLSIFQCHNLSNASLVHWTAVIPLTDYPIYNYEAVILQAAKEEPSINFQPPAGYNETAFGAPCIYESIGECNESLADIVKANHSIRAKCLDSISYVENLPTEDVERIVYSNRFCFLCNQVDELVIKPTLTYPGLLQVVVRKEFGVLVSFSHKGIFLKARDKTHTAIGVKLEYWSGVACDLSNNCYPNPCDRGYKNWAGMCTKSIQVTVAFSIPGSPLSRSELLALPAYLACHFEKTTMNTIFDVGPAKLGIFSTSRVPLYSVNLSLPSKYANAILKPEPTAKRLLKIMSALETDRVLTGITSGRSGGNPARLDQLPVIPTMDWEWGSLSSFGEDTTLSWAQRVVPLIETRSSKSSAGKAAIKVNVCACPPQNISDHIDCSVLMCIEEEIPDTSELSAQEQLAASVSHCYSVIEGTNVGKASRLAVTLNFFYFATMLRAVIS